MKTESLCHCAGWCREPQQNKLPISLHHPNCERYKIERFAKITVNGSTCIAEEHETAEYGDEYEISTIEMTRDQFEALPDFQGW